MSALLALCSQVYPPTDFRHVVLTPLLGFPIVAVALLTLLFRAYHRRGWGRALLIAVIATTVIWMLFAQLLHVPLEAGLLERVLY